MEQASTLATDESPNGFLVAFKSYASQLTDAPTIYIDLMGLSLLSLAIGRTPIEVTPKAIYPNIWLMLIGKSHSARKSTVMELAKEVIPSGSCLLANDYGTREVMAQDFSLNPQGLSMVDECGKILRQLNNSHHYQSGLDDDLCIYYNCPDLHVRKTVKSTFNVKDVCFNMVWATTNSRVEKYISLDDLSSGFLARFLFVYGERNIRMPVRNRDDIDIHRQIQARNKLQEVWNSFHKDPKLKFVYEGEALELIEAWSALKEDEATKIVDDEEQDAWGAIIGRAEDYVKKISALYEVDDILSKNSLSNLSKPEIMIKVESVTKAEQLMNNLLMILRTNLLKILNSSFLSRSLVTLTKILQGSSEEWVSYSYVLPRMNMTANRFAEILRTAYECKVVDIKQGRPQQIKLLKVP